MFKQEVNGKWIIHHPQISFHHTAFHEEEIKSPKQLLENLGVEKVIFNKDATIVYLNTGEKGVAKRSKDDEFDPVIGFSVAYAIAEGTRGEKGKFKELVNKIYNKQVKQGK